MNHPAAFGDHFSSPGGGFVYTVLGPVCRLYDREELPWPCCSVAWRGKQPSWNRVGARLVSDLAAARCPSYAVDCVDQAGHQWTQVVTLYHHRLEPAVKKWWVSNQPKAMPYPELPEA